MLTRSIGARLALAYLLPSLAGLAALGFWVDHLAATALEEELGRKVVAVASAAAAALPADRLAFLQPGDEETRTYANLRERLVEIKEATAVRRLLVFDPRERALLDVGGGARIGEPLPELARDRLELSAVLSGTARASEVLFEVDGRHFKAGYAPVRVGGEVVGVVLVEGSAEHFSVLRDFRASLLALGLLAVALLAGVSFLFARTLSLPIRRLVEAARGIGGGDLQSPIVERGGGDELAYLGRTLDEMREKLLARDRELQMMLAGIAHEVRNPLGGMELYAGLLSEELAGDEERSAYVRKIRREIGQLERIVSDFLDYARARPLQPSRVSSGALLEEVAGLVGAEASKRQVTLRTAGDPLPLSCDAPLLRRALLNLVHNAVQAAPAGTVVHLRTEPAGAGRIRLVVADEGKGVAPEHSERIFEPFFTTKEQGTGLGLAFVRKIAEAHGGSIVVGPTPGGGATFSLELPATPRG